MFLVFSKLCLSSISCLFFKPFPAFSYGFSRVSFLQFPHFPTGFLNIPWFFQPCHSFFPPFECFFNICLHFPPFFCNPSPLLPRHHSSSPSKPSCSEPQRTLLSVELRILSFFNMLASMFLAFSKLCLASISCLFFKPFPAFLRFFQSFLPAISSFSNRFPQYSLVFPSLPFIFSFSFMVFHNFLHFPPFSPCV